MVRKKSKDSVVQVTSKGQATIPVELRRRFGISAPGRIRFVAERGRLEVRAVRSVDEMMGSIKPKPGEAPLVDDLHRERSWESAQVDRRRRT